LPAKKNKLKIADMLHLSLLDLKMLLCFGFAAGITFFLIPSIVKMANIRSLYAEPNQRTSHPSAVPTLGGIAIFIGFFITYLLFLYPQPGFNFQYIIAASLLVFFVGFKDDLVGITPFKKFFGQLVAAWIVISFGEIRLTNMHGFFGIQNIDEGWSYMLTIIAILGIINCFNLTDGVDGLCAGLGIVASLAFGSWFYYTGDYNWLILCISLTGSLVAFFYFNVFGGKNKIFMGDTGSLITGFIISLIAIRFNETSSDQNSLYFIQAGPAVAIGIIMVPFFDTLRVMTNRIFHSTSPFLPDKTHIHHYLLKLGFNHLQTTLILLGTALLFIGISILLSNRSVLLLLGVLLLTGAMLTMLVIFMAGKKTDNNPNPL
jgi:UDP-N-acetylmuramyl pentapeptide phosphotransferase/UDP-N-acetylglucosamine-1-phosphate transferase